MANIDCQAAFNQEMSVLSEISKTSKDIFEVLKTPQTPKPDTLEAKIDETNRLLKLLCMGILGKDK
ncbi:hypothetical protein [Campylobacter showae]|uniref:Uncharacterized protein n=1 Tax=Campylobacter showae CC57C TaxID=1073353 RepID=M3JAM2_9BACT|nr:hypothetical protein [Campylobacter showae]EMG29742.1 hypothetical protein H740_10132 [Campylobacter showae CC57C]